MMTETNGRNNGGMPEMTANNNILIKNIRIQYFINFTNLI